MDDNIRVVLASLPPAVEGFTVYKDDYYTIMLNQNLSYFGLHEAYRHEIEHIKNDHFFKYVPVRYLERQAR